MDMERVLKGSPWTFNNHLLVLYKLQWGEDPLKVPLIFTPFWVQIHDIPIGFFSENLAVQLGNFIEYDGSNLGKKNRNYMRIRVQIDIRRPLKRKKQLLFYGKCSYVRFKYERLSLFYFYCGCLGHSDSFCEAKMVMGVECAELGWDLSLCAQSRRALTMNNVWLREEVEGVWDANRGERYVLGNNLGVNGKNMESRINIDPILGINLEGGLSNLSHGKENVCAEHFQTTMEHDLEDGVLIEEEGKKRARREIEDSINREEINTVEVKNRIMVETNNLLPAAAKRQADRVQ
ncbi:hypothetical protein Gogos_012595 [Gossypium gossypioides]|uniref:Zinc knuckle CX2CX4HX4C domain-containing protein n=1 Tax=Gossypium gossypioides TaxID=34282 RepID=A0A7J9BSZ3_GOSGO|nr:hypothetical protein [Gossypium gossypioides]